MAASDNNLWITSVSLYVSFEQLGLAVEYSFSLVHC